jgi:RNA polymerase sigma factor (TIGR02999 family)
MKGERRRKSDTRGKIFFWLGMTQESVANLMSRFRNGEREAAGRLVEMFYPQLKRIAASRMRGESASHTWQPTVLVNELYLELVKVRALRAAESDEAAEKAAFLNLAAHLMRRLLIHHSRPLSKQAIRQEFDEETTRIGGPEALQQIESALDRLGELGPQFRRIVELRVFEGMSCEEIAAREKCSLRTVTRQWTFARNWLAHEFGA